MDYKTYKNLSHLLLYLQKQNHNRDFDNLWYEETEQGSYVYYSGEFDSIEKATFHMNELISQGYKNIFIITLTK